MKRVKDVKSVGIGAAIALMIVALTSVTARVGPAGPDGPAGPGQSAPNTLTPTERAAGWKLLFDGKSIAQWRGFKVKGVPAGWQVVDEAITQVAGGPDLVSLDQFGSFDFRFDWRVAPGSNSGVMFHVSETGEETYHTGPEYQVLDNLRHEDGKNILTSAAACYGLYAPPNDVSRPANAWNEGRIVINGTRGEHWLNGQQTASFDMGSADWKAKVAASKFNEWKAFGTFARGHLALQQHGGGVAFRNLKIKASGVGVPGQR